MLGAAAIPAAIALIGNIISGVRGSQDQQDQQRIDEAKKDLKTFEKHVLTNGASQAIVTAAANRMNIPGVQDDPNANAAWKTIIDASTGRSGSNVNQMTQQLQELNKAGYNVEGVPQGQVSTSPYDEELRKIAGLPPGVAVPASTAAPASTAGMPQAGPITESTVSGTPVVPPVPTQTAQATPALTPPPEPAPALPPPPKRAGPKLTITSVQGTPSKGITQWTLSRLKPEEGDAESLQEVYRRAASGESLIDAVYGAEANGFPLSAQMRKVTLAKGFSDVQRGYYQALTSGKNPMDKARANILATVWAAASAGIENASGPHQKMMEEYIKKPLLDPQKALLVSDIVGNDNLSTEKKAAALAMLGVTPQDVGIRALPTGQARAFERLPATAEERQRMQAAGQFPPDVLSQQERVGMPPTTMMETPNGVVPVPRIPGAPPVKKPLLPRETQALIEPTIGLKMMQDLTDAYTDMLKATGGSMSGKLRRALAASSSYQGLANFTPIAGQGAAEEKFAAAYNSIMGHLRLFANQPGHFSDADALLALKTIGRTFTTSSMFYAQQRQTMQRMADKYNLFLKATAQSGRDISGFSPVDIDMGHTAKVKDVTGVWIGPAFSEGIEPPKGFPPGWVTPQQYDQINPPKYGVR